MNNSIEGEITYCVGKDALYEDVANCKGRKRMKELICTVTVCEAPVECLPNEETASRFVQSRWVSVARLAASPQRGWVRTKTKRLEGEQLRDPIDSADASLLPHPRQRVNVAR